MSLIIFGIAKNSLSHAQSSLLIETLYKESGISLDLFRYKEIVFIFADYHEANYSMSRDDLLRYAHVIEHLAKSISLLPMRYKSLANSTDQLSEHAEKGYHQILTNLELIDHKEEFAVRVLRSPSAADNEDGTHIGTDEHQLQDALSGDSPSRIYLRTKYAAFKAEELRAVYSENVKRKFIEDLAPISLFYEFKKRLSPSTVMDAVVLVDKDKRKALSDLIAGMQKFYPQHNILMTGPWPPYSFANIDIQL